MRNKESIELSYNKKYEKAIQDGLKIRLVKPTCDCCKKPVDNSKDSESVTDAWNKIDRFYKDAESMRNKQKCTGSKSFSVLTDDVVSSEKIACYEFEHNDGDQIWTDCTEFYKNADGTYKKVFTDGWNGSKSECTVSLDDIRQMVNKCKSSEMYYRRGGCTILQDLKCTCTCEKRI